MTTWRIDTFDALTAGSTDPGASTVLIVTDNLDGVSELGTTLITLGYRVQVAMAIDGLVRGTPQVPPSAVILRLTDLDDQAGPIVDALREHIGSPLVPFIGYFHPTATPPDGLDSTLFDPCSARQIAGRVDATVRLQAMQYELLRRQQVLRICGIDATPRHTDDDRKLRVLFIGKAKPEFMTILDAMRNRGVEVTGAFTSFTAFDYLHGREFDAVIIDTMDSAEPAQSILASMQRNMRLFHVPKICLVRKGDDSPCPRETLDLATDIVAATDPVEEITNRILEPATYHRIHASLRAEFDALGTHEVRDSDTGLYSREFLERYLDFLASEGEARQVCVIRLLPRSDSVIPEPFIRVAFAQAGGILSGLVRINDLVVRLGEDSFAVALPPLRERDLQSMTDRVRDVLEAAAFETGRRNAGPFTLDAEITLEDCSDALPAATRVSRLLAA